MEALRTLGYLFILYCDDILIATKGITSTTVTENASIELRKLGMVLNINKCSSTENGGTIKFLDQ
jgi:hypothetical protein